ncbi:hypothetical protein NMN56_003045, partial [Streptomyces iconiensis]|nr:hypothetical protein [Streptomyces iconiensis]
GTSTIDEFAMEDGRIKEDTRRTSVYRMTNTGEPFRRPESGNSLLQEGMGPVPILPFPEGESGIAERRAFAGRLLQGCTRGKW